MVFSLKLIPTSTGYWAIWQSWITLNKEAEVVLLCKKLSCKFNFLIQGKCKTGKTLVSFHSCCIFCWYCTVKDLSARKYWITNNEWQTRGCYVIISGYRCCYTNIQTYIYTYIQNIFCSRVVINYKVLSQDVQKRLSWELLHNTFPPASKVPCKGINCIERQVPGLSNLLGTEVHTHSYYSYKKGKKLGLKFFSKN